jgi:hypothetical protein
VAIQRALTLQCGSLELLDLKRPVRDAYISFDAKKQASNGIITPSDFLFLRARNRPARAEPVFSALANKQ